jgi:hypothetical protein
MIFKVSEVKKATAIKTLWLFFGIEKEVRYPYGTPIKRMLHR